jgi:hypothetical protein
MTMSDLTLPLRAMNGVSDVLVSSSSDFIRAHVAAERRSKE